MSTTKIAGSIIATTALEFLAAREGLTVTQVADLIARGHEGACRQFAQLVTAGADTAIALGVVA
jgi:hypothetical protein